MNKLDIAVALARGQKNMKTWRNKPMTWEELVARTAAVKRTAETVIEYWAMPKEERGLIKTQAGGYFGGYLTGGLRRKGQVLHRQLLTLDADQAGADFWDVLELVLPGMAAVAYSTHSSTRDRPRLRLIIPLKTVVSEEQYQPLARAVAELLGMNRFDATSYQATQLMYWPSASADGPFAWAEQKGDWLDPEQLLAFRYPGGWQDISAWPMGDGEQLKEYEGKAGELAADPTQKPGWIGAFCRAYRIEEAIATFLGDVYQEEDDGRYTYKGGSTTHGVILFADGHAKSYHDTDPAGGRPRNAFDLVRIHLFGELDLKADLDRDHPGSWPSFKRMEQLCLNDAEVREEWSQEDPAGFFQEEEGDEPGLVDEVKPPTKKWRGLLKMNRSGFLKTLNNFVLILQNDPRLKGRLKFNEFTRKGLIDGRGFTDADLSDVRLIIEKDYNNLSHKDLTQEAVQVVMKEGAFHPVRDYLAAARRSWDGERRLDRLLVDYLGAEDNDYTRAVTRTTLVAAVARIHRPGIKFDHVLTLVGPQGAGKSTLVARLGGAWYSDSLTTVQGKEAAELLAGFWLIEMGELAGLRKHEAEIIKNFISRPEDVFRAAYGRNTEAHPRECIFIGTTNTEGFLKDATGNRRFWPVPVTGGKTSLNVWRDLREADVLQIWGEAVAAWEDGEPIYLDREMEQKARERQEDHHEVDDRATLIQDYLEILLPSGWDQMDLDERIRWLDGLKGDDSLQARGTVRRQKVSAAEIWLECLRGAAERMDSNRTKPIHDIMKKLEGWERAPWMKRGPYGKVITYIRAAKTGEA